MLLWQRQSPFQNRIQGLSILSLGAEFGLGGKTLALAGGIHRVTLLSPAQATATTIAAHQSGLTNLALHPTQDWITSTSEDRTVKLWDFEGNLKQTWTGHDSVVLGADWQPQAQHLVAATAAGTLYQWNPQGTLMRSWNAHTSPIWDVAYSPQGNQLASASNDGTVRLWSSTGQILKTLDHGTAVWRVAFSGDGQYLASGGGDMTAKLWRSDGTLVTTLRGHNAAVWGWRSVLFSQMIHRVRPPS